jgi:hypothetical protein
MLLEEYSHQPIRDRRLPWGNVPRALAEYGERYFRLVPKRPYWEFSGSFKAER